MADFSKITKKDLRPLLHFTSMKNWLNDPNGFSYYDGKYHLFYQYNPKGITWGNMSWGHAVSEDLIYWEHLDVALLPDENYDQDGVFSGSALTLNNKHALYYTGIQKQGENFKQVQCLATSSDGVNYSKFENNPILEAGSEGNIFDFRDPKVWIHEGIIYLIVTTNENNCGQANLYTSTNGIDFEFYTKFSRQDTGFMWECPDLFQIGDQWQLIFSAMGIENQPVENISYISPVQFDYHEKQTQVGQQEKLDYSDDFYAPQTMLDEKNRRIMIAWLRMEKPLDEHHNWTGMMTLPREIYSDNNIIHYRVIDEIFEDKEILKPTELLTNEINEFIFSEKGVYEFNISISTDTNLKFNTSVTGNLIIKFNRETRKVYLTRIMNNIKTTFESPIMCDESIDLQIIIDSSVVEVFVNKGQYVLSAIYYELNNKYDIEVSKSALRFEVALLNNKQTIK